MNTFGRRLIIYLSIWTLAALVLATRADFGIPEMDDPPEHIRRIYIFVEAPFWISYGLDAAITRSPCLMCWLILLAFVAHALLTFSCTRQRSFIAMMAILVLTLPIGVFFALLCFQIAGTGA